MSYSKLFFLPEGLNAYTRAHTHSKEASFSLHAPSYKTPPPGAASSTAGHRVRLPCSPCQHHAMLLSPTQPHPSRPYRPQMQKQTLLRAWDTIHIPSPGGFQHPCRKGHAKAKQSLQNERYSQSCEVNLLLIHNLKRMISPSCPYRDAYYAGWVLRLGSRSRS